MPVAISVNHLREIISRRLQDRFTDEEVPIPSSEWIRLQFWPRNPYTATALRYTGKYDVKYAVQCQQLRHEHPDSKYVAVILRYAKQFSVLHSESILMISVDDKAIVPVGDPQRPVSTGVRGHNRSLVIGSASNLKALDHDFHVAGVVPSVSFFPRIPGDARDSFFSGPVFVTLKDKVMQPSNALRHATELSKVIESNFSSQVPQILLLISDGGSDHRVTFLSVKVALIALFLKLDVDMLIAIRICPYQSWSNMAERVMSTLNLALQNVSLAREEMAPELEAKIRYKTTLTALREVIHDTSQLSAAYCDSMSPVIARLAERFNQMKLKEDPITCFSGATDEEISNSAQY